MNVNFAFFLAFLRLCRWPAVSRILPAIGRHCPGSLESGSAQAEKRGEFLFPISFLLHSNTHNYMTSNQDKFKDDSSKTKYLFHLMQ